MPNSTKSIRRPIAPTPRLLVGGVPALALVAVLLLTALAPPPAVQAGPPPGGWVVEEYPFDEGDSKPGLLWKVITYPANRFLDMLDVAGFNLGFGIGLHVNVHVSRILQFGLGGASVAKFGNGGGAREYGVFQENRGEFSLFIFSFESFSQTSLMGSVIDYQFVNEPDRMYTEKRSYWGFGGDVTAAIVSVGFEFRPVELFDFLAGFLLFDPMQDDF